MNNIAIKIENLSIQYPNSTKRILNGIDLEIEKNTITAIVGRIGGGKSTLLKQMNGIDIPQKGNVIINGKSVRENPNYPFHQEVGLLFENPDDQIFYPIVADDIAFGPRNLKLPKDEVHRRVLQSAKMTNILHLLQRETTTLSYGEKTLVALAGLLAMKSNIILMDQPEVGLDLWSKPKILNLLEELSENHTIVVTTNDTDLLKIADKIHLLWHGKIRGNYTSYRSFRASLSAKRITPGKEAPKE